MTSPSPPSAGAPYWTHCGHGADPTDDPVGCRGVSVTSHTACLAHLPDTDRHAYLASLAPGADIDHRGTSFTEDLLAQLLSALRDPSTGKVNVGTAWFEEAQFVTDAHFDEARFSGRAEFDGARFIGLAWFDEAQFVTDAGFAGTYFSSHAGFDGAQFMGDANFRAALFSDHASFDGAQFSGHAGFDGVEFFGVSGFRQVQFSGDAGFDRVQFHGDAKFDQVQFSGNARFGVTEFAGEVHFVQAKFAADVMFNRAMFASMAWFRDTQFTGDAVFDSAQFSGQARFVAAQFSGDAGFSGVHFSAGARFDEAKFSEDAGFDTVQFSGNAVFELVQFFGNASFRRTKFGGDAGYERAQFLGDAGFGGAQFTGDAGFDGAQFSGDAAFETAKFSATAWFGGARFASASVFGPVVCDRVLELSGAVFEAPVTVQIAAPEVRFVRTRWESTATVRLRYATVDLSQAVLVFPVAVTAYPTAFSGNVMHESTLAGRPESVRMASIQGADAAHLVLTDIDLTDCLFSGAFHLDQLRLEGRCTFALPPTGLHRRGVFWPARCTRRRTLAEEHHWRAQIAGQAALPVGSTPAADQWRPGPHHPNPGLTPDPEDVAALYRQLRKAFEDSKNEPGAADFYYGECEMRRHDRAGTPKGERRLLWGYWLLSGYGLRASRAMGWLLAAMSLTVLLLMGFGLPTHDLDPATTGTLHGDKISLHTSTPDPALHGVWDQRMTWSRAERATRVAVNSVIFRSSGQNLTIPGTYIEMASRLLEPTLLALAALAVRGRIKR